MSANSSPMPLTVGQSARLHAHGVELGAASNVDVAAFDVAGPLNLRALGAALDAVTARHQALRLRFDVDGDGEPFAVLPGWSDAVPLTEASASMDVREMIELEQNTPFDLRRGPFLRARVQERAGNRHMLTLATENLVCDGHSFELALADLGSAYRALSQGDQWDPPVLETDYRAFVQWHVDLLSPSRNTQLLEYWRSVVGSAFPRSPFARPDDRSAPSREGHFAVTPLPPDLITTAAERCRSTPFAVFAAALARAIGALLNTSSVTFIAPVRASALPGASSVVGNFTNMLPLRLQCLTTSSFREAAVAATRAVFGLVSHADLPYSLLAEHFDYHGPRVPQDGRQLFLTSFQPFGVELSGCTVSPVALTQSEQAPALFDISFWLVEDATGVRCEHLSRADAIDVSTCKGLVSRAGQILAEGLDQLERA